MTDTKLVKLNISFKCPMQECTLSQDLNGAECLRCVLISVMGDQQVWDEVQAQKVTDDGDIDITAGELPDNTPEITPEDLEFLASPYSILMGVKEWSGPALKEAVDLQNETNGDSGGVFVDLDLDD